MHRLIPLLIAALLSTAHIAPAQTGIGEALVFTGLTTTTSGGETYAWLSWQPTGPAVLSGRTLALYRKSGAAASASPFTRISVLDPASDTRLVSSLLPAAQKVGQDMASLNTMLNDLLGDAMAAPSITVSDKITALLSAAWGNAEQTLRVQVLALQHPAIALCASLAFADKIPAGGVLTYELRDFDAADNKDLGVIGRVTMDPAAPFVLPAPGVPVEIPDTSPKGNLNVSLRWATPNALRDVAPLHHGYNLYRVPKAVAEAHGWQAATAPTAAALDAEPQAARVNRFPILPQKMLTAGEAANAADTTTVFATDDHNRFQPGGTPFTDDSRFYYFIAARDILGRSGQPSPGTLVRIYDRMAPNPPRNTRVRNVASYNGTVRDQRFFIEWDLPVLPPGETISAWFVYRWRTPHEIPTKARQLDPVTGKPERNLIAVLPAGTMQFTDNGTTAPPAWAIVDEPAPDAADKGKTYFYTVRAADGSISANLSGNSAPAWGVLRDRNGPVATTGTVLVTSFAPHVTFTDYTQVPLAGLTKDQAHLVLTCESTLTRGLDWAEFRYSGQGPVHLGRARFSKNPAGQLVALLRKTLFPYASDRIIECRIGTTSGAVSPWVASGSTIAALAGNFILGRWNAELNTRTAEDGALNGWRHEASNPFTGAANDVCGTFTGPAGAKEYHIYRRVNDSVQTLVTQGEITTTPTTWKDTAQPASSATVEYFLQTYDVNSNASPLVTQGAPLTVVAPLPTPMLESLKSILPISNAKMRVKWFCSTAGVERFEIWVARKSGSAPESTDSGLSADLATHPNMDTSVTETAGLDFAVFQTGLTRHLTAGGTPEFEALLPVSPSDTYSVMIRAVGPGDYSARAAGAFSNVVSFMYSLTSATLNNPVPWPERALPPRADFHPGIAATYLSTNKLGRWNGNAVRIGEYEDTGFDGDTTVDFDNDDIGRPVFNITSQRVPTFYLYTNDAVALAELGETIPGSVLPVALYRVQIANSAFPNVPGDIVQVSPLMEQIAYFNDGLSIKVTDPFVAALHQSATDLPRTAANFDHDILLLDRQPVIKGARYKYLLVRFTPGKEIERVIVTNTVDVPN